MPWSPELRRNLFRPQLGRPFRSQTRAWHRDAKDCTALFGILGPDAPVVSLDNRVHNRQPEPQALRLRGEERLEEVLPNIRCQSRPVVAHGNFDFLTENGRTDGDL